MQANFKHEAWLGETAKEQLVPLLASEDTLLNKQAAPYPTHGRTC